jgi:hypothetical protein
LDGPTTLEPPLVAERLKVRFADPDATTMSEERVVDSRVIRPSAVLDHQTAVRLVDELRAQDVASGGRWLATPALWQHYDVPWNGPGGSRGTSQLMGSIAVMYDAPARQQITLYRVALTDAGLAAGFSVDSICNTALTLVGLTLDACPRAEMAAAPSRDPFRRP